ncbi:phosphoglycerate mutase-like protein [Dioszegia hungarica]|uniref:Phosphoglycerate mutase-like protein n=1 Tax=Dioszegia hungarica TaxID=4972 RepID=A0AA38HE03_9TREE|nr:phosphoglycerate mutase-like protein [Dioszegia hungarica]KAI9638212.1 phosphoglycerate mutase-like protein [Dioszegia hungarica]
MSSSLEHALTAAGPPGTFTISADEEDYGRYNWACMPHVRREEYVRLPEEYELRYVEVIQRHHKRTPYASNTLYEEDIEWDCPKEGPFHHGKSQTRGTTSIYWQTQRNTNNPIERTVGTGFRGSSCTFPTLTSQGIEDARRHGEDFGGVYRDMLHFLPTDRSKYEWRVTNNVLTTQTLGGFAAGLYPTVSQYPAKVQPASFDSLEPAYACPLADRLLAEIESDAEWTAHLVQSQPLRDRFNSVTGTNPDALGWKRSWDHPFDNLASKQSHGLPLPCSLDDRAFCIDQTHADRIYRLGNWESLHRYRGSPQSLLLSVLKMGDWITELRHNLEAAVRGEPMLYRHNFAHDGSIAALLGILQIDRPEWPGMGAEAVFELYWRKEEWFIRVLYSGQTLETSTPLGTLNMVKLSVFIAYLDQVIPDLVEQCTSFH